MNIFEPAIFYCILSFAVSSVILLLAVLLLGIRVPPNESLTNFNDARKYLALSYFVLSIAGFIRFFSQGEAENQLQLASCTLIIGSLQALLFTYTILTLIQPLYIKTKQIYTQLAIISIVGIVLFLALFFGTDILFTWIFYLIIVAYILQMAYYTYIYQLSYNACLHTLETYYEDDERARLRWVNFFFYCALAVGIVAIISLFLNLYFYMLFCIVYTFYYAYVVWRFYNYQIDFKFAMPIIYNKAKYMTKK